MLDVRNLSVFYGDAQALAAVSLEVGQGAIVAIVGANGAGKTSLIRAIAGMLRPARGRILFGATDIAGWPSHRVCNLGIGQQGFHFGGKQEPVAIEGPIERLYADPIARDDQQPLPPIPERKSEHPVDIVEEVLAFFFVKTKHNLGIGT